MNSSLLLWPYVKGEKGWGESPLTTNDNPVLTQICGQNIHHLKMYSKKVLGRYEHTNENHKT